MLDLFHLEVEAQGQILTAGLLALERSPAAADQLEECMRAAHSLKGAASIVGLQAGVRVAHAMEDCFVAAQQGSLVLRQYQIDRLLRGVDLLGRVETASEVTGEVDGFLADLKRALEAPDEGPLAAPGSAMPLEAAATRDTAERVLRVTAQNLNRLLGLTGESLVESRRLKPFLDSMLRLKRLQNEASAGISAARESLVGQAGSKPPTNRWRPCRKPCVSASTFWRIACCSWRCLMGARQILPIVCMKKRWPAACGRSRTPCRAFRA